MTRGIAVPTHGGEPTPKRRVGKKGKANDLYYSVFSCSGLCLRSLERYKKFRDQDKEVMRIYRQKVAEANSIDSDAEYRPYKRGRAHAPELDPPSDLSFQEEPEEDE